MDTEDYENRIKALSERSRYVENVLRHAFVSELSSVIWSRDPLVSLQVFNSEVDDSGFDLVLCLGSHMRYVQLKQAHANKVPTHCSVRLSFSNLAGSCVVLMAYSLEGLHLDYFRFFGGSPSEPMAAIDTMRPTKVPDRRDSTGERKTRTNYRDVPVNHFQGPLSAEQLVDVLFPNCTTP
jgi:predicted RNA binding protein YcfA (HicA-like mRNA interferase family)